MKKTLIFSILVSLLAGAGLMAGISYGFGAVAEAGIRYATQQKPGENVPVNWKFDLAEYQRGFLSSETRSEFQFENAVLPMDLGALPLSHVIYHGPLAITPEGPKFCSYHIVTTLQKDKLKEMMGEEMVGAFKGREPLTVHTTTFFGGSQATRVEVAPFNLAVPGQTGSMKFDGARAELETGPGLAYAKGDFRIGAFKSASGDSELPNDFTISPITGSLDYLKDRKLVARVDTGDMTGVSLFSNFKLAPSGAEIDWLKDDHFKAQLTMGTIEAKNPDTSESVAAGPGTLLVDYKRFSKDSIFHLGESKFHLEKLEGNWAGQEMLLEDFIIRSELGERDDELFALVHYEIGRIQAPEDPDSPVPFNQVAGGGAELEAGIRGLSRTAIENISKSAQGFSKVKPDDPEESMQFLSDLSRDMLDVVQPGAEIYYKVRMRGAEGLSLADLNLKMGGDKKLTELKTVREMLAALDGDLVVRINKKQFTPEQVAAMLGEDQSATFFEEKLDRLEMNGELSQGKLSINGEPSPLLDGLGPSFDEPIDWDLILGGMAAGIGDSAMPADPEEMEVMELEGEEEDEGEGSDPMPE